MEKLPPLKAMQAFEATARHLSFSRAADELFVTQSAVSHQVRALEDFLGMKLLVRSGKTVSLTFEGDTFNTVLGDCFRRMASVTDHLTGRAKTSLKLMAQTSIATEWLVPRLHDFGDHHPDIDTRLDTFVMASSFEATDYDILIGAWPAPEGFVSRKLKTDRWYPVCAPSLHEKLDPDDPASILNCPLYSTEEGADWKFWMQQQGLRTPAAPDMRHFNLGLLSVRAAIAGRGVALSNDFLASDLIAAGALKAMPQFAYSLPWGQYYLHHRTSSHNAAEITIFLDWVMAQISNE